MIHPFVRNGGAIPLFVWAKLWYNISVVFSYSGSFPNSGTYPGVLRAPGLFLFLERKNRPKAANASRLISDILPPLSLTLRSGGFSLKAGNPASINELSPRAPRFFFTLRFLKRRCCIADQEIGKVLKSPLLQIEHCCSLKMKVLNGIHLTASLDVPRYQDPPLVLR